MLAGKKKEKPLTWRLFLDLLHISLQATECNEGGSHRRWNQMVESPGFSFPHGLPLVVEGRRSQILLADT